MFANNPIEVADFDQHIVVHPYKTWAAIDQRDLVVWGGFMIIDHDITIKNYSRIVCVRLGGEYGEYQIKVKGWWL